MLEPCEVKVSSTVLRGGNLSNEVPLPAFATRKLIQGHDHLTIAELMGHRDGTMLAKVYADLDRNDAHLKKALED